MKTQQQATAVRLAIPYYGALSLHPSGLSRVFFLVEVNVRSRSVDNIGLQVWNPKKEPNLSSWLRLIGTEGIICSDHPSQYEVALNAEGIWVQWNQEGEVQEVVDRWLRTLPDQGRPLQAKQTAEAPCTLKPLLQMN